MMRRLFINLFKVISGLILLTIISAALLLHTAAGRTWLAESGMHIAGAKLGYDLNWRGIRSPEASLWIVDELTLAVEGAELFKIGDVRLRWRPGTLLRGKIILDEILIGELIVNEPDHGEAPADGQQVTAVPVRITSFSIESLTLNLAGMEQPQSYRLSGDLELFPPGSLLSADVVITPAAVEAIELSVSAKIGQDGTGTVSGWYREKPQGPAGTFLKLPLDESFEASLRTSFIPQQGGYDITIDDLAFGFHSHDVTMQGRLRQDGDLYTIDPLRIDIDATEHTLTGTIHGGSLDLQLMVEELPLEVLSVWTDYPLSGSGNGQIKIQGTLTEPLLEGSISARTAYKHIPLSVDLTGSATRERLLLKDAVVRSSDNFTARTHGSVDLVRNEINLDTALENLSLQALREFELNIPEEVNGMINARAVLSGLWQSPVIDINGGFSGNYKESIPVNLHITANGKPIPPRSLTGIEAARTSYDTNIEQFDLHIEEQQVSGEGHLVFSGEPLSVDIEQARIRLAGTTHTLSGEITGERLALNLGLNGFPLDIISPLIEVPVTGAASARIFLGGTFSDPLVTGSLNSDLVYQTVPIQLRTDIDASKNRVEIKQLNINADNNSITAKGVIELANGESDLNVSASNIEAAMLGRLGITIPGGLNGRLNSDFTLKGNWKLPVLAGNARFDGSYREIPVTMSLAGQGGRSGFTIEELKMDIRDDGYLTLQGEYKEAQAGFILAARDLPLALFGPDGWDMPAGVVTADITARGNLEQPRVEGKLVVSQKPGTEELEKEPFSMDADVRLVENRLDVLLTLAGEDARTGKIQISLPWRRYLLTTADQTLERLPLYGTIQGEAYLRELCLLLLDPDIHQCRGKIEVDLSLGDTFLSPSLEGKVGVIDGFYENIVSGTKLHDLQIDIRATGKRLEIVKATATDGEQGILALEGKGQWKDSIRDHEIDLLFKVDNGHLLRRYDMDGTANGMLTLTGDGREMFLSGALTILPFTLALETLLQEEIPSLEITESDHQARLEMSSEPKWRLLPVINMNIELIAEQQAFLRGPGLEAELQGKVQIQGTYTDPVYRGSFRTIRGSIQILGKRFKLIGGELRLEGEVISLLIPATYTGDGLEVRAELSGTVDNLKLSLTSTPPYPEDEIVSQLLFGKTAQNISPLQAIRLANTITMIKRGGRPLIDPLGTIEKALPVDRLTVEEAANGNGVLLGVGKYIHEKVYVELERGTGAGETWQGNVQIELLPNLNLENSVNGESGFGNLELQWKKDY